MTTSIPPVGGLTFAFGLPYQRMAYALALTLARNQVPLTVVVSDEDYKTGGLYPGLEKECNVVALPGKFGKFEYESHAFRLSPYDLTLKFDADMIVPAESYINEFCALIVKSQLVSGMACDLLEVPNYSSAYRRIETRKDIPTVYSAAFGFTKSDMAEEFYSRVKFLFDRWYSLKLLSKDLAPTTDSLYSIAWHAMGLGLPVLGIPFVHMKPAIAGKSVSAQWVNTLPYSLGDYGHLRVNSHLVRLPFHYHVKEFLSDAILDRIENNVCNY